MIEVDLKLLPYGFAEDEESLGKLRVVNTGDHERRPEYGNYEVRFYNKNEKEFRRVRVENHLRSEGVFKLFELIFTKGVDIKKSEFKRINAQRGIE